MSLRFSQIDPVHRSVSWNWSFTWVVFAAEMESVPVHHPIPPTFSLVLYVIDPISIRFVGLLYHLLTDTICMYWSSRDRKSVV